MRRRGAFPSPFILALSVSLPGTTLAVAQQAPGPRNDPAAGPLFGDDPVAEGRLERTVPLRFTTYAGMDLGKHNGEPVSRSYAGRSPFSFTGKIERVVFDLAPR